MVRLSQRALALPESAIRKLDLTVAEHPDVRFHRVNIGQPDVATAPELLRAIQSYQPDVIAYGPASGTPECRAAAATYFCEWAPSLTAQDVVVTTGGSEALLFAFTALCDPGDDLLVLEPYYTNYNGFATVAGVNVRPVPRSLDDGFALPPDAVLDAALTPRTRAIVFSNPCNPTGAVYGRDELERLARWAARHDLTLISDEVYRRIWFDSPPASALELDEHADRVVVVDSMSKTWSACGLRLGFLVSRNRNFMERVERLGQARLGPQPLAQKAAIAGLRLPETYLESVRQTYAARVRALHDAVAGLPGVKTHRPQGAFYLMVSLPVDDVDRFARYLVTEFRRDGESVVIAPGSGFYADPKAGRTQARLAAVIDERHLVRTAELLGEALERYTAVAAQ